MNLLKNTKRVAAVTLLIATAASAQVRPLLAEGGHVGGGDLCRNEINKHRQMIADWIEAGDAADLDFSKALNRGLTFDAYRVRMREVLLPGKVVVTCYFDPGRIADPEAERVAKEKGVSFKAITLGDQNLPTACINYEDHSGVSHIDCNYDSIVNQQSLTDPSYVLTHHEYASIAGVELRKTDSAPDFSVSNQITQFEKWVNVKMLGRRVEVRSDISQASGPKKVYSSFNLNEVSIDPKVGSLYQKVFTTLVASGASQVWPYQISDVERLKEVVLNQADVEFDRVKSQLSSKWMGFSLAHRLSNSDLKLEWASSNQKLPSCAEGKTGVSCDVAQSRRMILTSQNLALLVSVKGETFRENSFHGVPLVSNRAQKKQECHDRYNDVLKDPAIMAISIDDRLEDYGSQTQRSQCSILYFILEVR